MSQDKLGEAVVSPLLYDVFSRLTCVASLTVDVEELLAHGATIVVLSQGMDEQPRVDAATRAHLDKHGVEVHVLDTREAVKICNELADRVPVGDLLHSTC